MSQKALTVVIDEWSAAIAALVRYAPPDVIAQLTTATGDLLECFGSISTNMAAHEVVEALKRIKRLEDRTERRVEDAPHEAERRH